MTMNAIAIAIGATVLPAFAPNQLANLVAWYRLGLGVTVVTGVSRWADQSGNGNDLVQATAGAQPALQGDNSILFDGVAQFLKTGAFTLNQPTTIYIQMKQVAWTSGKRIADGNVNNSGAIAQSGSSPQFLLFAGGGSIAGNGNLAIGSYGSLVAVFNGASSVEQVNNTAAVTGDGGASNMGGFTLAAVGAGAGQSNIQVKEALIYSAAHDAATRAKVVAYLATL